MTPSLPFISTRKAHYMEAQRWAARVKSYSGEDKRKAANLVFKHLKAALEAK